MRRMTKKLLRIVSPLLVLALTLSVVSVRAGEGEVPEVVCAPVAAAAPAAKAETMPSAPAIDVSQPVRRAQTASPQGSKSAQFEQAVTATAAADTDTEVVTLFGFAKDLACAYLKGMSEVAVILVETGAELPEFFVTYTDSNGEYREMPMGMYFDEERQLLIGKNDQGTFATGIDVDLSQRMAYATHNGWERRYGFNSVYDFFAPAALIYFQTHHVLFEYGGMDWKIQIWKGNYFLAGAGGEVGIYNKPPSRPVEHYDCVGDEDMLVMSMRMFKGEQLLFERAPERHWWMTGFALSDGIYFAKDLTMESTILFEEQGMLDAFLAAFDPICAAEGITYTVDGLLVSFVW